MSPLSLGRTAVRARAQVKVRVPARAQTRLTVPNQIPVLLPSSSHAASREWYIDRLRTVMTVLVLVAHTGMTYGGAGFWFYREVGVSSHLSSILFSSFSATKEAYLMGFFFLLAGYFTPASYDRKGPGRFLLDRLLRLGIPLLFFGFVLAPTTVAMVAASDGHGFWPAILNLWRTKEFINGPLWFAQALLIFSFGYCGWRMIAARLRKPAALFTANYALKPVPNSTIWFLSAIAVGVGAIVLRVPFPVDARFFGLWLGYFSSFIFLFAVGAAAFRHKWLARVSWAQSWPWLLISVLVWPTLPLVKLYWKYRGVHAYFAGGFSFPAILYAFWEPFLAWGLIAAWLVWFRTKFNKPSKLQDWLARRAYAVYILHPPVLVGISLLLRNWHTSPLPKAAVVSILGCVLTWLAADPLVRLPGLRKIV